MMSCKMVERYFRVGATSVPTGCSGSPSARLTPGQLTRDGPSSHECKECMWRIRFILAMAGWPGNMYRAGQVKDLPKSCSCLYQ
ncbi:MAG: hypothetical protein K0A89_08595 [ANME-2 cluster archaeon]|nr:hypothetical protein [ANME-2 cluster archaeon]